MDVRRFSHKDCTTLLYVKEGVNIVGLQCINLLLLRRMHIWELSGVKTTRTGLQRCGDRDISCKPMVCWHGFGSTAIQYKIVGVGVVSSRRTTLPPIGWLMGVKMMWIIRVIIKTPNEGNIFFPPVESQGLVESIPSCTWAVLAARVGPTHY